MIRLRSLRVTLSLVTALAVAMALTFLAGGGEARAQTASVSIVDFAFNPGTITVEVGTTVTWTNNGAVAHTVTADDGSFDSGNMDPSATYSVTFDTPGTYSYFCEIHPNMTASVVVTGGTTDGGDDGGDGSAPTQMPDTGAGSTSRPDSTTMLLALVGVIAVLGAAGYRLRRAT